MLEEVSGVSVILRVTFFKKSAVGNTLRQSRGQPVAGDHAKQHGG